MVKSPRPDPTDVQEPAGFSLDEQGLMTENTQDPATMLVRTRAWLSLWQGEEITEVSRRSGISEERLALWRKKIGSSV